MFYITRELNPKFSEVTVKVENHIFQERFFEVSKMMISFWYLWKYFYKHNSQNIFLDPKPCLKFKIGISYTLQSLTFLNPFFSLMASTKKLNPLQSCKNDIIPKLFTFYWEKMREKCTLLFERNASTIHFRVFSLEWLRFFIFLLIFNQNCCFSPKWLRTFFTWIKNENRRGKLLRYE